MAPPSATSLFRSALVWGVGSFPPAGSPAHASCSVGNTPCRVPAREGFWLLQFRGAAGDAFAARRGTVAALLSLQLRDLEPALLRVRLMPGVPCRMGPVPGHDLFGDAEVIWGCMTMVRGLLGQRCWCFEVGACVRCFALPHEVALARAAVWRWGAPRGGGGRPSAGHVPAGERPSGFWGGRAPPLMQHDSMKTGRLLGVQLSDLWGNPTGSIPGLVSVLLEVNGIGVSPTGEIFPVPSSGVVHVMGAPRACCQASPCPLE